ncbi:MAG: fumarate hydratase, partial [Oscillospiraceae bacterium]|nr:fumarate hydratase [Oscillospiraceae bacterium]
MRMIPASALTDAVARLCGAANRRLPPDVTARIAESERGEPWETARDVLSKIRENSELAASRALPICQDTGMACVFLELGRGAHIDGDVYDAVNEGVRRGYRDGFLRSSVVRDPLTRVNTGDNTPAVTYLELVPGDRVTVTVAPKG